MADKVYHVNSNGSVSTGSTYAEAVSNGDGKAGAGASSYGYTQGQSISSGSSKNDNNNSDGVVVSGKKSTSANKKTETTNHKTDYLRDRVFAKTNYLELSLKRAEQATQEYKDAVKARDYTDQYIIDPNMGEIVENPEWTNLDKAVKETQATMEKYNKGGTLSGDELYTAGDTLKEKEAKANSASTILTDTVKGLERTANEKLKNLDTLYAQAESSHSQEDVDIYNAAVDDYKSWIENEYKKVYGDSYKAYADAAIDAYTYQNRMSSSGYNEDIAEKMKDKNPFERTIYRIANAAQSGIAKPIESMFLGLGKTYEMASLAYNQVIAGDWLRPTQMYAHEIMTSKFGEDKYFMDAGDFNKLDAGTKDYLKRIGITDEVGFNELLDKYYGRHDSLFDPNEASIKQKYEDFSNYVNEFFSPSDNDLETATYSLDPDGISTQLLMLIPNAEGMAVDAAVNMMLPGAGLANMAVRVFGESYNNAARAVDDNGNKQYTEGQALLYGVANAAVEYLSERIGGESIIDKISFGSAGKGLLDGAMDKIITSTDSRLLQYLYTYLVSGASEAIEEDFSELLSPIVDAILYDADDGSTLATFMAEVRKNYGEQEAKDYVNAAVSAAVLSVFGGGAIDLTAKIFSSNHSTVTSARIAEAQSRTKLDTKYREKIASGMDETTAKKEVYKEQAVEEYKSAYNQTVRESVIKAYDNSDMVGTQVDNGSKVYQEHKAELDALKQGDVLTDPSGNVAGKVIADDGDGAIVIKWVADDNGNFYSYLNKDEENFSDQRLVEFIDNNGKIVSSSTEKGEIYNGRESAETASTAAAEESETVESTNGDNRSSKKRWISERNEGTAEEVKGTESSVTPSQSELLDLEYILNGDSSEKSELSSSEIEENLRELVTLDDDGNIVYPSQEKTNLEKFMATDPNEIELRRFGTEEDAYARQDIYDNADSLTDELQEIEENIQKVNGMMAMLGKSSVHHNETEFAQKANANIISSPEEISGDGLYYVSENEDCGFFMSNPRTVDEAIEEDPRIEKLKFNADQLGVKVFMCDKWVMADYYADGNKYDSGLGVKSHDKDGNIVIIASDYESLRHELGHAHVEISAREIFPDDDYDAAIYKTRLYIQENLKAAFTEIDGDDSRFKVLFAVIKNKYSSNGIISDEAVVEEFYAELGSAIEQGTFSAWGDRFTNVAKELFVGSQKFRDLIGYISFSATANKVKNDAFLYDSAGNKLSAWQQWFFRNSKLRDEQGRLILTYSGQRTRFTQYDTSFADDKLTIWHTDDFSTSYTYTGTDRANTLYKPQEGNEFTDEDRENAQKLFETANKINYFAQNLVSRDFEAAITDDMTLEQFINSYLLGRNYHDVFYERRTLTDQETIIKDIDAQEKLLTEIYNIAKEKQAKDLKIYNEQKAYKEAHAPKGIKALFSKKETMAPFVPDYEHTLRYVTFRAFSIISNLKDYTRELSRDVLSNVPFAEREVLDPAYREYTKLYHDVTDIIGEISGVNKFHLYAHNISETSKNLGTGNNVPTYQNLVNPFIFDAKGGNWREMTIPVSQLLGREPTKEDITRLKEICLNFEKEAQEGKKAAGFGNGFDISKYKDPLKYVNNEFVLSPVKTRLAGRLAYELGYDGVIFKNLWDLGGYGKANVTAPSTIICTFNPNQTKDANNVSPSYHNDMMFSRAIDDDLYGESTIRDVNDKLIPEEGTPTSTTTSPVSRFGEFATKYSMSSDQFMHNDENDRGLFGDFLFEWNNRKDTSSDAKFLTEWIKYRNKYIAEHHQTFLEPIDIDNASTEEIASWASNMRSSFDLYKNASNMKEKETLKELFISEFGQDRFDRMEFYENHKERYSKSDTEWIIRDELKRNHTKWKDEDVDNFLNKWRGNYAALKTETSDEETEAAKAAYEEKRKKWKEYWDKIENVSIPLDYDSIRAEEIRAAKIIRDKAAESYQPAREFAQSLADKRNGTEYDFSEFETIEDKDGVVYDDGRAEAEDFIELFKLTGAPEDGKTIAEEVISQLNILRFGKRDTDKIKARNLLNDYKTTISAVLRAAPKKVVSTFMKEMNMTRAGMRTRKMNEATQDNPLLAKLKGNKTSYKELQDYNKQVKSDTKALFDFIRYERLRKSADPSLRPKESVERPKLKAQAVCDLLNAVAQKYGIDINALKGISPALQALSERALSETDPNLQEESTVALNKAKGNNKIDALLENDDDEDYYKSEGVSSLYDYHGSKSAYDIEAENAKYYEETRKLIDKAKITYESRLDEEGKIREDLSDDVKEETKKLKHTIELLNRCIDQTALETELNKENIDNIDEVVKEEKYTKEDIINYVFELVRMAEEQEHKIYFGKQYLGKNAKGEKIYTKNNMFYEKIDDTSLVDPFIEMGRRASIKYYDRKGYINPKARSYYGTYAEMLIDENNDMDYIAVNNFITDDDDHDLSVIDKATILSSLFPNHDFSIIYDDVHGKQTIAVDNKQPTSEYDHNMNSVRYFPNEQTGELEELKPDVTDNEWDERYFDDSDKFRYAREQTEDRVQDNGNVSVNKTDNEFDARDAGNYSYAYVVVKDEETKSKLTHSGYSLKNHRTVITKEEFKDLKAKFRLQLKEQKAFLKEVKDAKATSNQIALTKRLLGRVSEYHDAIQRELDGRESGRVRLATSQKERINFLAGEDVNAAPKEFKDAFITWLTQAKGLEGLDLEEAAANQKLFNAFKRQASTASEDFLKEYLSDDFSMSEYLALRGAIDDGVTDTNEYLNAIGKVEGTGISTFLFQLSNKELKSELEASERILKRTTPKLSRLEKKFNSAVSKLEKDSYETGKEKDIKMPHIAKKTLDMREVRLKVEEGDLDAALETLSSVDNITSWDISALKGVTMEDIDIYIRNTNRAISVTESAIKALSAKTAYYKETPENKKAPAPSYKVKGETHKEAVDKQKFIKDIKNLTQEQVDSLSIDDVVKYRKMLDSKTLLMGSQDKAAWDAVPKAKQMFDEKIAKYQAEQNKPKEEAKAQAKDGDVKIADVGAAAATEIAPKEETVAEAVEKAAPTKPFNRNARLNSALKYLNRKLNPIEDLLAMKATDEEHDQYLEDFSETYKMFLGAESEEDLRKANESLNELIGKYTPIASQYGEIKEEPPEPEPAKPEPIKEESAKETNPTAPSEPIIPPAENDLQKSVESASTQSIDIDAIADAVAKKISNRDDAIADKVIERLKKYNLIKAEEKAAAEKKAETPPQTVGERVAAAKEWQKTDEAKEGKLRFDTTQKVKELNRVYRDLVWMLSRPNEARHLDVTNVKQLSDVVIALNKVLSPKERLAYTQEEYDRMRANIDKESRDEGVDVRASLTTAIEYFRNAISGNALYTKLAEEDAILSEAQNIISRSSDVSNWTTDELDKVVESIKYMTTKSMQQSYVKYNGKKIAIEKSAKETLESIKSAHKLNSISGGAYTLSQLNPSNFFRYTFGDKAGKQMFALLEEGYSRGEKAKQDSFEKLVGIMYDIQDGKIAYEKHKKSGNVLLRLQDHQIFEDKVEKEGWSKRKNVESITIAGQEYQMTRDELWALYRTLCASHNAASLALGGYVIADKKYAAKGKMRKAYDNGKTIGAFEEAKDLEELKESVNKAIWEVKTLAAEMAMKYAGEDSGTNNVVFESSDLSERVTADFDVDALSIEDKYKFDQACKKADDLIAQRNPLRDIIADKLNAIKSDVEAQLTDYDKAVAKAYDDFFGFWKDSTNEAAIDQWGFGMANVGGTYMPMIMKDPGATIGTSTSYSSDANAFRATTPTILRHRNSMASATPTLCIGLSEIAESYAQTAGNFVGLNRSVNSISNIMNQRIDGKTLFSIYGAERGEKAATYLSSLIDDLNGRGRGKADNWASGLLSNLAKSSLGLNPRVELSQRASYWMAATVLDYDSVIKGWSLGTKSIVADEKFSSILRDCALLQSRLGTNNVYDVSSVSKIVSKDMDRSTLQYITDNLAAITMAGISNQDYQTCTRLFRATYIWCENHPEIVKESKMKLDEFALVKYAEVLNKTQPVVNGNLLYVPEIRKNKNFAIRSIAMFSNQSNQNLNLIFESALDMNAAKKGSKEFSEAKGKLGRAVSGLVVSSVEIALIKQIVSAIIHHDPDDRWRNDKGDIEFSRILASIGLDSIDNTIRTVIGGSELSDLVGYATGFKTGTYYGFDLSGFSTLGDAMEKIVSLATVIRTEYDSKTQRDKALKNAWLRLLPDLGTLSGLPAKSVEKMIDGISTWINQVQDTLEDWDLTKANPVNVIKDMFSISRYQDVGYTRTKEQIQNILWDAYTNVDDDGNIVREDSSTMNLNRAKLYSGDKYTEYAKDLVDTMILNGTIDQDFAVQAYEDMLGMRTMDAETRAYNQQYKKEHPYYDENGKLKYYSIDTIRHDVANGNVPIEDYEKYQEFYYRNRAVDMSDKIAENVRSVEYYRDHGVDYNNLRDYYIYGYEDEYGNISYYSDNDVVECKTYVKGDIETEDAEEYLTQLKFAKYCIEDLPQCQGTTWDNLRDMVLNGKVLDGRSLIDVSTDENGEEVWTPKDENNSPFEDPNYAEYWLRQMGYSDYRISTWYKTTDLKSIGYTPTADISMGVNPEYTTKTDKIGSWNFYNEYKGMFGETTEEQNANFSEVMMAIDDPWDMADKAAEAGICFKYTYEGKEGKYGSTATGILCTLDYYIDRGTITPEFAKTIYRDYCGRNLSSTIEGIIDSFATNDPIGFSPKTK